MKNIMLALVVACGLCVYGCRGSGKETVGHGTEAGHEHHHEHTAAHGGCLNAIGTCDNGHCEARLDDGILMVWFVGGGSDTAKAVRVPNTAINLVVTIPGDANYRAVTLAAFPDELAEEKEGACSRFKAGADWLKGVTAFTATGLVNFKGVRWELRIEYPAGYDPD